MDDRGTYSTLELAGEQHHSGSNGYAAGLETVPPSSLPQVVESQNLPEVKSEGQTYASYTDPAPPYDGERRICGLRRKVFIIIAALVALLVVGAAVGGAVGGTVGKSKSTSKTSPSTSGSPTTSAPPSSSQTATPTTAVLSNSSLTSANWTDANGYSHHAVFYQSPSNSLMLSLWDSQNTTWAVKNVSVSLNSTFAALPGTPLSTAVTAYPWPFQMNLYYLSPSNQILELYTLDPQGGNWKTGSLSTYNLKTGTGSQLASYWQRCSYQCSQEILLLYEDASQKLNIANGSDWANPYSVGSSINTGSGLALIPLAPLADVNTQPYQLRAYVDISESSQEYMWVGDAGDGKWLNGGLPNLPLSSPPPKYAATAFGTPAQGPYAVLLVFLFSNGTISANWFDNTVWHNYITPSPMPKSNFSAIAINMDLRFYGISAGSIYEYGIDEQNPFNWNYINPINTTLIS